MKKTKKIKSFNEHVVDIKGRTMHPSTNYKVGDFLVSYYRGTNGGVTGVYRIASVGHSAYTTINIQSKAGLRGTPLSVNDTEILSGSFDGNTKSDYFLDYISKDIVDSMIIEIEKNKVIETFMETEHSISGVEKGKEKEYWLNTDPVDVAVSYARKLNKGERTIEDFKIVKLLDFGRVVYDPYDNFRAWGHKPIDFK